VGGIRARSEWKIGVQNPLGEKGAGQRKCRGGEMWCRKDQPSPMSWGGKKTGHPTHGGKRTRKWKNGTHGSNRHCGANREKRKEKNGSQTLTMKAHSCEPNKKNNKERSKGEEKMTKKRKQQNIGKNGEGKVTAPGGGGNWANQSNFGSQGDC